MRNYLFTLLLVIFVTLANKAQELDSIPTNVLKEVVVEEYRKYVRTEGPLTTISISGSPFSVYQDFSTMLENLPGMSSSGTGPIVIGAGKPIYYVDGREIKDLNELKAIQPSNVKLVEINRIPDIEYGSNGAPVVIIKLKKNPDDYVYLNVGSSVSRNRNFGGGLNFNFRYKYKGFSTSLFTNEGTDKTELKETYTRSIDHPNDYVTTSQYRDLPKRLTGTILRYIAEYRFSKKSFIGVYYNFNHMASKSDPFGTNSIVSSDVSQYWNYSSVGRNIKNSHNATIQWDWSNDKIYFRLTQDAFYNVSPGHYRASETMVDSVLNVSTSSRTHASYDAYTTNAKIWFQKLPWKLNVNTGVRYDHVNSNTTSIIASEAFNYSSSMKAIEDNASLYLSLSRQFGKLLVRPNLGYNYTHRSITSNSKSSDKAIVKQHYSTFTPRVYLQWNQNTHLTFYALYQRQISQPGFAALNSGLTYKSLWEWDDSNPDLKAQTTNEYTVGFSWSSLSGKVSYYKTKNYISQWEQLLSNNSDAVSSLFVNVPDYKAYTAELSYSNKIKKLNYFVSVNATLPRYNMLINNKLVKRQNVNFFANVNLSYMFNSHFSCTTSYTWSGPSYDVPLVFRKSWQKWNIGVQASLLNNRLAISLNFADILKTANYSNNISWYNNISRQVSGTSDSRSVTLRISYTFFNKRINTYTESGNDDLRTRIN